MAQRPKVLTTQDQRQKLAAQAGDAQDTAAQNTENMATNVPTQNPNIRAALTVLAQNQRAAAARARTQAGFVRPDPDRYSE